MDRDELYCSQILHGILISVGALRAVDRAEVRKALDVLDAADALGLPPAAAELRAEEEQAAAQREQLDLWKLGDEPCAPKTSAPTALRPG